MYNKRVRDNVRELSQNELVDLSHALDKWYPVFTQTYNTPLIDMMANPYKKGIIHSVVFLVIVLIILAVNTKLNFIKELNFLNKNTFKNPLVYIVLGVIFVIVFGSTAYSQYKHNENLKLMMTLTKPGATKYDYESSNVIQSKLMRDAYSRGGRGIAGGLIGYGIGSSGRKRR